MKTRLEKDWLLPVTYVYVFAPLLIFVFTWIRWYIGVPAGLLILAGMYLAYKKETPIAHPVWNRRAVCFAGIALAIVLLWVLTSGIGGSAPQYPDHIYRNILYKVLVDQDWPVYLQSSGDGSMRGMAYYIGFWLPAALAGKATSYAGGMLFMQLWAVMGILLEWFYICEKQQKVHLWYLAVFIFFGGLDPVGRLITGAAFTQVGNRYEWWAVIFSYPGMTTHLFWVYNQVIYAWILYCLIMRQKNNQNLLFIWCNALLCCTFPAVGLIPFVIYRAIRNVEHCCREPRLLAAVKRCVTYQNIVGAALALLIFIFIMANDAVVSNLPRIGLARTTHADEYTYDLDEESAEDRDPGAPIEYNIVLGGSSSQEDTSSDSAMEYGVVSGGSFQGETSPEYSAVPAGTSSEDISSEAADEAGVKAAEPSAAGKFAAYPFTTRLLMYLWFILLEFGLYYMVIYKSEHRKPVYWVSLVFLLVCPWIRIGYWIDFCLRASIPALFCLYMLVISALHNYFEQKEWPRFVLLTSMLVISSATTVDTLVGVMKPLDYLLYDNARAVPELEVAEEYYVADGENFSGRSSAFFFRYLAKKAPGENE